MQSLLTCSMCQLALNSQWPWHCPQALIFHGEGKPSAAPRPRAFYIVKHKSAYSAWQSLELQCLSWKRASEVRWKRQMYMLYIVWRKYSSSMNRDCRIYAVHPEKSWETFNSGKREGTGQNWGILVFFQNGAGTQLKGHPGSLASGCPLLSISGHIVSIVREEVKGMRAALMRR